MMNHRGTQSNHKTLGFYIGLAAVALAVLPMLLIFFVSSQKASDELLNIASNGIRSKAIHISHSIENVYESHNVTIKNLSQSDVYETKNLVAISQYLAEVKHDNPHLTSIEIADTTGTIVVDTTRRGDVGKNISTLYPSLKDKVNNALNGEQGDIFVSDLITVGHDVKGIVFITPITDDANVEVIYLLVIKTNMVAVNKIIEEFNDDDSYGSFHNIHILTKSGHIVTSTSSDLSDVKSFPLSEGDKRPFLDTIKKQLSSGTMIYHLEDGNEMIAGYSDITAFSQNNPLDWTVITSWSMDELIKPAQDLKKQIAIASIVIGLLIFILMSYMGKKVISIVWSQSNYDALTGLPNRKLLTEHLLKSIKETKHTRGNAALFFIDLDQFKEINDTLGHHIGDELLIVIAKRITGNINSLDTVSRIGGDEFAVIINEFTNEHQLEHIAQEMLTLIEAPIKIQQEVIYISASIGITIYPQDGDTVVTLLKNADQAMYLSKNEGRNQFHFFTQEMQESTQKRISIATRLHEAIEKQQFELYYQPIISLKDGSVKKAEALIRWHDPINGLINPADFIQIAEETNQIIDIGDWVFKTAARQHQEWKNAYNVDLQISINASPIQFKSKHLYNKWAAYLEQFQIPKESIIVEITENTLIVNNHITNEHLMNFRDAGIPVAIDDFGTGYSSLSYLNKLDIDFLKIDKSFIDGIAVSEGDYHLTEAIITVAHKLGLEVIAEGVETEDQHQLLKALGCDYCQGYLFSKPLPATEFERFLPITTTHYINDKTG